MLSPNLFISRRGEVWLVNCDSTVGTEIQKTRAAVVVSSDGVGRLPMEAIVVVSHANPLDVAHAFSRRVSAQFVD